jgi:cysteine sulfinate desulfinase/cysteine desulfurase-like protein
VIELDHNNKESQAYEKRVHTLTEKLETTRANYKVSKKEQNRLKHIVNFCFKNKADNHEWI